MTRSALVLSFLALALTVMAKTPETTLTIKVTDLKGKPVDRASVIIKFVAGHPMTRMKLPKSTQYELRTNQEGVAKFPPVPQGQIRVQVIDQRYETYGDVVDVSEDVKTLEIHLNPPQSQYSAHE